MRVKLIATISVLVLSIAICAVSTWFVYDQIDEMDRLTAIVLEQFDAGNREGAREALAQMATAWEKAGPILRSLTPHEDLHSVIIQYVEASTNLESDDDSDFMRSVSLLVESLKHLREHEALSWSNLF